MRILLLGLLSLCLSLPAAAQGFLDAFSKTGPNRPPAVEDQIPPDGFLMLFGPEPRVTGGRAVNLLDLAAVVQWRQHRRQFSGLADVSLDEDVVTQVMAESGGVPIAWRDTRGHIFIAIVGGPVTLTHFARSQFQVLNADSAAQIVVINMIHRGGCFDPLPKRHIAALGFKNAANCKK